ncbi:hypothetical protein [Methanoplanus endosymbiosus]|uniref:Uncharacterized protein n=1 Tax=Methanoplanus endosymbiosus TaxID=33865 RepID=A0A9E7PPU1_9EURY|nr:hypothetical protein [Methanoplanus endosymbiosus]UUX92646.1 hypothetical protein L6E24_00525 [Methanoplanus endosymbiosus]
MDFKRNLFFLCILFILLFSFTAGCTSENNEKMERAVKLLESADERINDLDFEDDGAIEIKSQMKAANVDYNEALDILDSIKTSNDDEIKMISALEQMIEADIILCEIIETDFLDFMTHLENAQAQQEKRNWLMMRAELQAGIDSLESAKSRTASAKSKINSINRNDLPSESKGDLEYMKTEINEVQNILDDGISELNSRITESQSSNYNPSSYSSFSTYSVTPEPPAKSWHKAVEDTVQVPKDKYYYWEFELSKGDKISVDVSTDGSALDLEIMDQYNYNKYSKGTTGEYKCWGRDSIIKTKYEFSPAANGDYYFVLDNSIVPDDGAYADANVNVNVIISKYY